MEFRIKNWACVMLLNLEDLIYSREVWSMTPLDAKNDYLYIKQSIPNYNSHRTQLRIRKTP